MSTMPDTKGQEPGKRDDDWFEKMVLVGVLLAAAALFYLGCKMVEMQATYLIEQMSQPVR